MGLFSEKKINNWQNEQVEKKLKNKLDKEKFEKFLENIEKINEEQAYYAVFFEDNLKKKLQNSIALEIDELKELSLPIEKIKNFTKEQKALDEKGNINTSAFYIMHATNFPAKKDGEGLYIESSGNADPTHSIGKYNEEYKHLVGVLNGRFTIHFGMPGYPSSHQEQKRDGSIDYDALSKRLVLYLAPLDGAIENNTICNLNASDTFFWDKFKIPEGTIIIVNDKIAEKFQFDKSDFGKYQIIITEKLPIDLKNELLKKNEFKNINERKMDFYGAAYSKKPKICIDNEEIYFTTYFQQHAQSIYHSIELLACLDKAINKKEYEWLVHDLHWISNVLEDFYKKPEEEPCLIYSEEMKKKILLKIGPVIDSLIKKFLDVVKTQKIDTTNKQAKNFKNSLSNFPKRIFEDFPILNQLVECLTSEKKVA